MLGERIMVIDGKMNVQTVLFGEMRTSIFIDLISSCFMGCRCIIGEDFFLFFLLLNFYGLMFIRLTETTRNDVQNAKVDRQKAHTHRRT